MRILLISNLLPPRVLGGYEIACWNIARGLKARGHDVLVLTSPSAVAAPEQDGLVERTLSMRAYALPATSEPHLKALIDHECMVSQPDNTLIVLDAVARFRPDHVLSFNLVGLGAMAILDALTATGVPWTLNLGDRLPNAMTEGVAAPIRELYGFADNRTFHAGGYSAVSHSLLDEIAAGGVDLGPAVTVVSRGVDVAALPERTRPYRDGGTTRFVSAGAIGEHKGIGLIVEAAALLASRGRRDFTIEVFGEGERERYQAQARDAGVADLVAFPGAIGQAELFAVHASSDAFLFPTWEREPFGQAPAEAAAIGCVPILTAGSGAAERLVDGVHCIKIERTAASLADAMLAVLDGTVDLQRVGDAGRALARDQLSLEHSVVETEAFLLRDGAARPAADLPAIRTAALERSAAALGELYAELDRSDAETARLTGAGTQNRIVRSARTAARLGRSVVRRVRPPAPETAEGLTSPEQRMTELEARNAAMRNELVALRRFLGED